MRPDNPFRAWLTSNPYGGTWVPVAGLGGWLGPAQLPVLFPRGADEVMLGSSDWPLRLDAAGPETYELYSGGEKEWHADLRAAHFRGETPLEPLSVLFQPPGRTPWLEPVQSFVLHHNAAPRLGRDGLIEWEIADDDGQPEVIARWQRVPDDKDQGVLWIRRDKLLNFMMTFGLDLAIYYEENVACVALDADWRDELREPEYYWRCWASDSGLGDMRVVIRAVNVLHAPAFDMDDEHHEEATLDYVVATDPETGNPISARYPGEPCASTTCAGPANDNFLTPVIFRREVLDAYLADTQHYTVDDRQLRAGQMWSIPYAITAKGHIQVWLGDLGRISDRAQLHWKQFNIADDDGPPPWRLEQDLGAQFVEPPRTEVLDQLRDAVDHCNAAALKYCRVPLFADVDGMSSDRARTLRIPRNGSLPAFQDQIATLAIVVNEHIDHAFLDAVGAPKGGSLARLSGWIETVTGSSAADAKDAIGGLFAVQAIRSKAGGAHRGGSAGNEALRRSEIELDNLADGFERLVARVVGDLEALATTIEELQPIGS